MATEILMPRLSDTMSEGTIAKWRKQVGEAVAKGDILVEIETDKATMELEAFQAGTLGLILIPEGTTVPIGEPIALLAAPGEELPPSQAAAARPRATEAPQAGQGGARAAVFPVAPPAEAPPESPEGGRVRASPLARRLAQEFGVDLRQVTGTGPGGRITREDVEAFARSAAEPRAPVPVPREAEPLLPPAAVPVALEADEVLSLSPMQQTIVSRMVESKSAAPHFYVTTEIDMAEAVAFRRSLNEALGEGRSVTFNDLMIKAVSLALRSFPEANASFRDGKLVRHGAIHVGVAVAIPDGLVVPVVRDADKKSLVQIAGEAHGLVERARNRRLALEQMEGSTFTITNLGMYDVEQFTAIINQPNAAILAVGSILRKPVVKDDQIVISDRMRVTLSADHRILYGAGAAQFLREVKRILEHPLLLVV